MLADAAAASGVSLAEALDKLTLSAADRQMAEELDDVKRMNQMMLYSKV